MKKGTKVQKGNVAVAAMSILYSRRYWVLHENGGTKTVYAQIKGGRIWETI